jgi:hypothetical protein
VRSIFNSTENITSMPANMYPVSVIIAGLNIALSNYLDIANFIYENPTALDLSLQGIWIADRT